ncbi:MAG: hypothetical protein K0R65_223 [Crocinitomicaceae bacterium]|jgi:hypothetical protein|nr:hypothetical protein [Crocinitomicaceae bacterium]
MTYPNIFTEEVTSSMIERINKLTPETQGQWGKMNVSQMLAHCCVTYEYLYTDKYPRPKGLKKWLLKTFVKGIVTTDKPYKKSSPTAKDFIIVDARVFDEEKRRLISFLQKTQQLGEAHFDGQDSHSFGVLNKNEWNTMFYKHLDYHLGQFGA